jgi:hypothetical protein
VVKTRAPKFRGETTVYLVFGSLLTHLVKKLPPP